MNQALCQLFARDYHHNATTLKFEEANEKEMNFIYTKTKTNAIARSNCLKVNQNMTWCFKLSILIIRLTCEWSWMNIKMKLGYSDIVSN